MHGHDDSSHDHDDGQDHDHRHAAPGISVVLDIGGEVGALIVYLASMPPGGELEARPTCVDSARFHTGVHLRDAPVGTEQVLVAVFPEVREGAYELLAEKGVADTPVIGEVTIVGGEVTELDLR